MVKLIVLAFVLALNYPLYSCQVPEPEGRGGQQVKDDKPAIPENFKTENLVVWCIVPFDAKNRGPAERAEMVRKLGLTRVAYDWREQHIPEFEQEILEYKKRGIEYFAFWGWHDSMEPLIKKHGIKPQIWQMFRGKIVEGSQAEKLQQAAAQFLPLVEKTRSLGLKLGIYNHGGWAGNPENMIALCDHLRKHHNGSHVGIVYNFHHGHQDVASFPSTIKKLKPYLICLNINGMADPETVQKNTGQNKILPVGSGVHERGMIKSVIDSGYDGPIGILGHRAEMDAQQSVGLNIKGLRELFDSSKKHNP